MIQEGEVRYVSRSDLAFYDSVIGADGKILEDFQGAPAPVRHVGPNIFDVQHNLLYYYLQSIRTGEEQFGQFLNTPNSLLPLYSQDYSEESYAYWAINCLWSLGVDVSNVSYTQLVLLLHTLENLYKREMEKLNGLNPFDDDSGGLLANTPLNAATYNFFPPAKIKIPIGLSDQEIKLIFPITTPPFFYGPKQTDSARVVFITPFNKFPNQVALIYLYLIQQAFNNFVLAKGEGIFYTDGEFNVPSIHESLPGDFFIPSRVNITRFIHLLPEVNFRNMFFNYNVISVRGDLQKLFSRFNQLIGIYIQYA